MMKRVNNERGFTLIELLIVIVIIGILAGVVLAALNPLQQQRRARDATTRSTLSKMALSTKSLHVSSPRGSNRSPTPAEFGAGVGGIANDDCINNTPAAANQLCRFDVDGIGLGADCDATAYNGAGGSDACRFVYWRDADPDGEFRIGARGQAKPEAFFVFHYQEISSGANSGQINEGFYTCDMTYRIDTMDPSTGAGGCVESTN